MSEEYSWTNAKDIGVKDEDFYKDACFLKTNLGVFIVQSSKSTGLYDANRPNDAIISLYKDISDVDNDKLPLFVNDRSNSVDTAIGIVMKTVDYINNNKNLKIDDVKEFINSSVKTVNETSKDIEIARKAGYVQGVCECVAAIGEDHALGKKLLSEMKVDRDMAKKYANPETFKTLEKGIFSQKSEIKQELEQTQSFKL